MLVTRQLTVTIDLIVEKKKYYGSHWLSSTAWLPTFSKKKILIFYNLLCSIEEKKKTHTGLDQHEEE